MKRRFTLYIDEELYVKILGEAVRRSTEKKRMVSLNEVVVDILEQAFR